jgi:hypothetical protein
MTPTNTLSTAVKQLEDARAIEIEAMRALDDAYDALVSGAITRSSFTLLYEAWITANMRREHAELAVAHEHGKVSEQRGESGCKRSRARLRNRAADPR